MEDTTEHSKLRSSPLIEPMESSIAPTIEPSDSHTKPQPYTKQERQSSVPLLQSPYILFLVVPYIALALFAWIIACILSIRPFVEIKHYGVDVDVDCYGSCSGIAYHNAYVKNEHWWRAARVLSSIASVLTIPLTSAVCSAAAVVYVQRCGQTANLTLRQVITLADKGWTDPYTFAKLCSPSAKRYATRFLLFAIALNTLGGLLAPIQQVFLSTETIKTPVWPQLIPNIFDIPDAFGEEYDTGDSNLNVALLRHTLASTNTLEPQARLWQAAGQSCNALDVLEGGKAFAQSCASGNTFGNVSTLGDPFVAQLPSGYSTGLIRQYLPRFASTAVYESISSHDWPSEAACDGAQGAFSVKYSNTTYYPWVSSWGLEACMPGNLSHSPWLPTRDRQSFTETLYINASLVNYQFASQEQEATYYRVTVNTTAGYFELPNYMNGNVAGPVLEKSPESICKEDCEWQWGIYSPADNQTTDNVTSRKRRSIDDTEKVNFAYVSNKGPLLTTAIALFGEHSFIDARLRHPSAFASTPEPPEAEAAQNSNRLPPILNASEYGQIIDIKPLALLLGSPYSVANLDGNISPYILDYQGGLNGSDVDFDEIAQWIALFNYDTERLSNAFTSAALLAHQLWMERVFNSNAYVSYDLGADTAVPRISHAGIIVISVLLGLDVAALLALALYASVHNKWASKFDAFTLLMIGAANAEKLPLVVVPSQDEVKELDEMPGWIGDSSAQQDKVGSLSWGMGQRLGRRKRYVCYDKSQAKTATGPPQHVPYKVN